MRIGFITDPDRGCIVFEDIGFEETTSLVDYDAIVWEPSHSLLFYEDDVMRLRKDIDRRKADFKDFLDLNGILFIIIGNIYIEGKVSNILEAIEPHSFTYKPSNGTQVIVSGNSPVENFLKENSAWLSYAGYITDYKGKTIATAGKSNHTVAAELQTDSGKIFLIPQINDLTVYNDFFRNLIDIVRSSETNAEYTFPDWSSRFWTTSQIDLATQISEKSAEIEIANTVLTELNGSQLKLQLRHQLFVGTGTPLENEVKKSFQSSGWRRARVRAGKR